VCVNLCVNSGAINHNCHTLRLLVLHGIRNISPGHFPDNSLQTLPRKICPDSTQPFPRPLCLDSSRQTIPADHSPGIFFWTYPMDNSPHGHSSHRFRPLEKPAECHSPWTVCFFSDKIDQLCFSLATVSTCNISQFLYY